MNLALPLGLLGLCAIAALILIYIFKPKYQDKKVSSTYVWKLSLQYRKRKIPLQWLQGSLLFLLQVLILALIAVMMAQPYAVLASNQGEKIVVLDASASMLAQDGGKSRFERAKDAISSLAEDTVPADRFSVILAGQEASFVIRRSDSAGYIKQKLFEADCGYTEPDEDGAMELAEGVLAENPSAEVYYYTDHAVEDSGTVHVVDISRGEWNAAVENVSAVFERGRWIFTAQVSSYNRAAEMAVSLTVDGEEQLSRVADCGAGETVDVVWDSLDIYDYARADVSVVAQDSYPYDNAYTLFGETAETFKVQLVSDDPGFLYFALSSVQNCRVTLVSDGAQAKESGYDLYVYNRMLPERLPADGNVWFVDPTAELASVYGFTLDGVRAGDFTLTGTGSTSEAARTVLRGLTLSDVTLSAYSRIQSYRNYENLISCDGAPVLLAKNENGYKTLVLAFDIHMSNLPMLADFPRLVRNMCAYTLAHTVEGARFGTGETVRFTPRPNAQILTVRAEYAGGGESEEIFKEFPVDYLTARAGVYTLTQTFADGSEKRDVFCVDLPCGESAFGRTAAALAVPIAVGSGTDLTLGKDTVDLYVYFAAALLALVCVEWGLQYREQV